MNTFTGNLLIELSINHNEKNYESLVENHFDKL